MPDSELAERLRMLRQRIATAALSAGRTEQSVTLVAVSKGHPAGMVAAAAAAGCRDFGENYLQEALPKLEALRQLGLSWHYIGRLQSNKTRPIALHFDWVHGLDRVQIATRLSQQRPVHAQPLNVCLQLNVHGEASKAGVAPEELPALAAAVASLPRLKLRGLMCMLPDGLPPAAQREGFERAAAQLAMLRTSHPALDTLSMGMSGDFEAAIAAGATLLRIGTAIFGPRGG